MGEPGSVKVWILLGSISLAVLLAACFNYVNFTTARYLKRAREAGILPDSESDVAVFRINSRLAEKYPALKEQLEKYPFILHTTAVSLRFVDEHFAAVHEKSQGQKPSLFC